MGTKHQRNSARNQREEQHTTNEQPSAKPARACRNRLLRARNPRNILETGTIVPNPPQSRQSSAIGTLKRHPCPKLL